MRKRFAVLASIILSAVLILPVAGCNEAGPQYTTQIVEPSSAAIQHANLPPETVIPPVTPQTLSATLFYPSLPSPDVQLSPAPDSVTLAESRPTATAIPGPQAENTAETSPPAVGSSPREPVATTRAATPDSPPPANIVIPTLVPTLSAASKTVAAPAQGAEPSYPIPAITVPTAPATAPISATLPKPKYTAIWGSSASDVFVVGFPGAIKHYDGNSWQPMESDTIEPLTDVWGTSPTDVFAVGNNGVIRHYDGKTWQAMDSGTTRSLSGVYGSSSSDVYAVGGDVILHYDGKSWSTACTENQATFTGVWCCSSRDVYVAGYEGTILYYDGDIWQKMITGTKTNFLSVWGSSTSDVFVVGSQNTFSPMNITHYNGVFWDNSYYSNQTNFQGVWGSSASDIYLWSSKSGSAASSLRHFDDNGWSISTSELPFIRDIWGSSSTDLYLVTYDGDILHNVAFTTTPLPHHMVFDPPPTGEVTRRAIWPAFTVKVLDKNDNIITVPVDIRISTYYALIGTTIMTTQNGSATFDNLRYDRAEKVWVHATSTAVPDITAEVLVKPYDTSRISVTPSEITLVSDETVQFKAVAQDENGNPVPGIEFVWDVTDSQAGSIDAGGLFTAARSSQYYCRQYTDIIRATVKDGVDTGLASVVIEHTPVKPPAPSSTPPPDTSQDFNAIYGFSASDIYAVGKNGLIQHFDGISWKKVATGSTAYFTDVWGSSPTDVFVTGYGGNHGSTILHYDGSSWQAMDCRTSRAIRGIWGSSANDVFAVGDYGLILHYDGSSWKHLPEPGLTNTLYDVWGTSATNVFTVGHSIILHYDGNSWEEKQYGRWGLFSRIWGFSPADVYIGGGSGTILQYNGMGWQTMQSGTGAEIRGIWGTSPDNIYALTAKTILRYDGSSWSNYTCVPDSFESYTDIWGSSAADIYIAGSAAKSGILHNPVMEFILPPSALVFTTPPGPVALKGYRWQPFTLKLTDAKGNLLSASIEVSVRTSAGPFEKGTVTRKTVNGVVTFDDLEYNQIGTVRVIAECRGGYMASSDNIEVRDFQNCQVVIAPDNPFIKVGESIKFSASARDAAGSVIPGIAFSWSVTDSRAGQIDAGGTFTSRNYRHFSDMRRFPALVKATVQGGTDCAAVPVTIQYPPCDGKDVPLNLKGPEDKTLIKGQEFNVTVEVACEPEQEVVAVDTFVNFDPRYLEAVAITPAPSKLTVQLHKNIDNINGFAGYSAGAPGFLPTKGKGTFNLAVITFRAKEVVENTPITFSLNAPRGSMLAFGDGQRIPGIRQETSVNIIAGN